MRPPPSSVTRTALKPKTHVLSEGVFGPLVGPRAASQGTREPVRPSLPTALHRDDMHIHIESVTEYGPHFSSKIILFYYNHREYVICSTDPYTVRLSLPLQTWKQQHVSDQMSCKKFLDDLMLEHK